MLLTGSGCRAPAVDYLSYLPPLLFQFKQPGITTKLSEHKKIIAIIFEFKRF